MAVPNALLAPLQAHSGEEAVAELVGALSLSQQIPSAGEPGHLAAADPFGPPIISGRIALTSVFVPTLSRIVVALGISPAGLHFESDPHTLVNVILLTAWGTECASDLRGRQDALLHAAADPAFRNAILSAISPPEAAACFASAPTGHYRTIFMRHYSPLVADLVYVTD